MPLPVAPDWTGRAPLPIELLEEVPTSAADDDRNLGRFQPPLPRAPSTSPPVAEATAAQPPPGRRQVHFESPVVSPSVGPSPSQSSWSASAAPGSLPVPRAASSAVLAPPSVPSAPSPVAAARAASPMLAPPLPRRTSTDGASSWPNRQATSAVPPPPRPPRQPAAATGRGDAACGDARGCQCCAPAPIGRRKSARGRGVWRKEWTPGHESGPPPPPLPPSLDEEEVTAAAVEALLELPATPTGADRAASADGGGSGAGDDLALRRASESSFVRADAPPPLARRPSPQVRSLNSTSSDVPAAPLSLESRHAEGIDVGAGTPDGGAMRPRAEVKATPGIMDANLNVKTAGFSELARAFALLDVP